jgi:two-component system cell cycle response regulator DivK
MMAKTVLIVEDDELNLRFFDALLRSEGYATQTARSGPAALAAVRARRPDLILMDIELPEGSGLDVADTLRRDGNIGSVPVVAVTAHAMRGDAEHFCEKGCAGYVSKPVTMKGLLDAVRKFAHS